MTRTLSLLALLAVVGCETPEPPAPNLSLIGSDLCAGRGKPHPNAAEPSAEGPNTVRFHMKRQTRVWEHMPGYFPHQVATSVEDTAYVACAKQDRTVVESCEYDMGVLDRVKTNTVVKVYALKTQEKVAEVVVEGGDPPPCAMFGQFEVYGRNQAELDRATAEAQENGGLRQAQDGTHPDYEDIYDALAPVIGAPPRA